jgi:hypothetical protein
VMVIDRESLNPKVIIENTKIRFRLKNSQFQNDPENGEAKKIGFNIFKTNDDGTSTTES